MMKLQDNSAGGNRGRCHVYLVPGFFGFTSLGSFNYFYRVAETLRGLLHDAPDFEATVIECRTKPTASITWRAEALLQEVLRSGGGEADVIHFVGHSMGGLDLRALLSPGANIEPRAEQQRILAKTRSVTTIATPHFGSPIASFFTTLPGRQVLRSLAGLSTRAYGRRALVLGSHIVAATASLGAKLGIRSASLDYWTKNVLRDLSLDPNHPVWSYFADMATDQGSIIQLTPEAMHLFNAVATEDRAIDYGCVVTYVDKPTLRDAFRLLPNFYATGSRLFFWFLHHLAARRHPHYHYSPRDIGVAVDERSNDGVAPTLSQVHGKLLLATRGDHLDVVGQYAGAGGERLADWMSSGSGFGDAEFTAVWTAVARHIVESSKKV